MNSFDVKSFDTVYDRTRLTDEWSKLTRRELRKTYESFNEIRLLMRHACDVRGSDVVEIGCSTGELYRYISGYHPRLRYKGFDVAPRAIQRAKEKYPEGQFQVCAADLAEVRAMAPAPAVLFSRDVILHQTDPFGFLKLLLSIPTEALILRMRTRDKGATVLDVERSCQYSGDRWFPYMVLNMDEVIDIIRNTGKAVGIDILKNYKQLGGWHGRFLPKECYEPDTGTAETAMYIRYSMNGASSPKIEMGTSRDSNPRYSLLDRCARYFRNRLLTSGPSRSPRS